MSHRHGVLHYLTLDFDRTLDLEAHTRTHVQLQRDEIQLFLAVYRQLHSLGPVLAHKAADVILASTLPKIVRAKAADRHTGLLGALRLSRHFPALVVVHALAYRQRHAIERWAEVF